MCFSIQVDRDLNRLAQRFQAKVDRALFEKFLANKERNPKLYKGPDNDNRIFPNTYAPVIVSENNQRVIKPMRYRVRPAGSREEVPNKFNVFNARLDSLENRKTWTPLFMKKHCLVPIVKFYEWVEHENKKKLISFYPQNEEYVVTPGLFDHWESRDGSEVIDSFAVITTEPPTEIEEMGHDRCPINLNEEYIDEWLNPNSSSKDEIYEMLTHIHRPQYLNQFVV